MTKLVLRWAALAAAIVVSAVASGPQLVGAEGPEQLIVACARPCAAVVATVAGMGGQVTQRYDNVDAVAVSVPTSRVAELSASVGADAVRKDVIVTVPPSRDMAEVSDAIGVGDLNGDELASFLQANPDNYNYNNGLTGASALHAAGNQGQDVVVGLIDSGTASVGLALAGSVIGGENFVPTTQDPVASATSRKNDWHGTGTATMIAGHAAFVFGAASRLPNSLLAYAPGSVIPCPGPPFSPNCPSGALIVPMTGTAPGATIYAMKVFPSQGGGSPESRIIAAMDRAITLRRNFNNHLSTAPVSGTGTEDDPFQYNALNIQVVNMSLGGPTLFAGRDLEDQLTLEMLKVGITLATSAGNDGMAALTGGSPGTGIGSITAGASNTPVHERVLRDNQFGLGIGALYRPFNGVQTAYFSSRGPTADGRFDPDISANGFASFVTVYAAVAGGAIVSCGAPNAPPSGGNSCLPRILFVSGTSFSSPTVAGAAALLRKGVPTATALQARNALIQSANPNIVTDGSGRIDQGLGFLDVPAALALLQSGHVSNDFLDKDRRRDDCDDDDEVGGGGQSVLGNLMRLGIDPVRFRNDRFSSKVTNLLPGQVKQFYIPSDDRTDRLVVKITNIVREGPENVFFGDDLFVMIADAPTSFALHRFGDGGDFVFADTTINVDNPQNGVVRLAIQGDWTNANRISADVSIERVRGMLSPKSAKGKIEQDDQIPFTISVPPGAAQGVFELFWKQNWGRYPTNDLDMLVIDPVGNLLVSGATLSSPERVVVTNPMSGDWKVVVSGFTIQDIDGHTHGHDDWHGHGSDHDRDPKDFFTLRATADGQALKISK